MPVSMTEANRRMDIPITLFVSLLLVCCGMSSTLFGIGAADSISRIEGKIILLILGCSSIITPLSFAGMNPVDAAALILSCIMLLLWAYTGRKCRIDRWEGALMLLAFALYYYYLFTKL